MNLLKLIEKKNIYSLIAPISKIDILSMSTIFWINLLHD